MAYWLGMLFADGCVIQTSRPKIDYSVHLMLSCVDYKHTEKFKAAINSTYRSCLYKKMIGNKECLCSSGQNITCTPLALDLIGLGCVPRKSLALMWPQQLPNEYAAHFVRGYFDGDGCLHYDRANRAFSVHFCGSSSFINSLQSSIKAHALCGVKPKGSVSPMGSINQLQYSGNPTPMKLLDWMYKDSTEEIRMDRKFILYQQCVSVQHMDRRTRDMEMRMFLESVDWKQHLQCQCPDICPRIHGTVNSQIDIREVQQLNQETGAVIKDWKNANTIEHSTGFKSTNVLKACRGEYRAAYGFSWRFKK